MKRIGTSLLVWAMLAAFAVSAWAVEPTMRDLFRAKAFLAPGVEQELGRDVYHRDWDFGKPDRGNFT